MLCIVFEDVDLGDKSNELVDADGWIVDVGISVPPFTVVVGDVAAVACAILPQSTRVKSQGWSNKIEPYFATTCIIYLANCNQKT
uniref:Uncharacterized protein n=1 Tax=Romanomermis culicivorax TaxID=13658 RepID=A0A915HF97_ROMCU